MTKRPRLYKIQDKTEAFEVGILPDTTQVIIGIQAPNLVIVRFTPHGAYEQIDYLPIQDDFTFAAAEAALTQWRHQSNFLPAPIAIEKFFLEEHWIGIADLPQHYNEVLEDPSQFDAERLAELLADIDNWKANGDFVFYWDEDYYLNNEGEITSS